MILIADQIARRTEKAGEHFADIAAVATFSTRRDHIGSARRWALLIWHCACAAAAYQAIGNAARPRIMVWVCQVRSSSGTAIWSPGRRDKMVPSATWSSMREVGAETVVQPVAEGDMRVGVAGEVEFLRVEEDQSEALGAVFSGAPAATSPAWAR